MSYYVFMQSHRHPFDGNEGSIMYQAAGPYNAVDLAEAEKVAEMLTKSSKKSHFVMKLVSTFSIEDVKIVRDKDAS